MSEVQGQLQQYTFTGEINMSDPKLFTIEEFHKYIGQGRLMAGKCRKCGKTLLPPRPLCDSCLSGEFDWVEIPPKGRLLTYTIIHVAPPEFQEMTPYAVGIVEFDDGIKIPGMIKGVTTEKLKVGMTLGVGFEACTDSKQWPQWPRYHFKPA
jgi:uncharacterized OB-fold protein